MTDTPWKRGRGALAVAAYFVLLPAAGAAGALALAPLQAMAGVLGAPYRQFLPPRLRAPLLLFCAFIGWAALSALWSPYPDHTQALKLGGGVACGLLFVACVAAHRAVGRAAGAAAALVLAAMLVFEALTNMALLRLADPGAADSALLARTSGRGVTVLVCIAWGGAAALARGGLLTKATAALMLATTAYTALQFNMDANIAAFGCGLAAAALAIAAPRPTLLVLFCALAAWLLGAPWVIGSLPNGELSAGLPDSWAMREAIWRYAAEQVQERPWFGWGLDGPRTFTDMLETRGIVFRGLSLHPHSASLQIWLETGLVGTLLAAGALTFGGLRLARALAHDRLAAAAAAGSVASIGLFANVSYGVWQEWWIATAFTAAAIIAAVRDPQSSRS